MRRPENETERADGDAMLLTRLDVTDPASIKAALERTIDRFGDLDVVVNNAGYGGDEQLQILAHAFRNKMSQVVGAQPQYPQEVADLVYACAPEPPTALC